MRTGLISNPLDPGAWSDTIADELDIDFTWLDSPDYSDEFLRARERFEAAMRHHVETQRPRELNRIADDEFSQHGIVDEHEPITDPEALDKIVWDISRRFSSRALNLPHVENLTGEAIVAHLKTIRDKTG